MRIYSAREVALKLPYGKLVDELRRTFALDTYVPLRSLYQMPLASGSQATLGLMPAWCAGEWVLTKIFTSFPDNHQVGVPTIHSQLLIFDGATGVPTAIIDGTEVTRRRTAATSALAALYLAREDSENLLIVGTGPQALHQALAHAAVRSFRRVSIWGRSADKARRLADLVRNCAVEFPGMAACLRSVEIVKDLKAEVREADVISCATSSVQPIVCGDWLKPGSFLDLVGSHSPDCRECDGVAAQCSQIYVDTLTGALSEAGDILIPIMTGIIQRSQIVGDLHDLCRGTVVGRVIPEAIILFKSVGSAVEDLAAARLILKEVTLQQPEI